MIKISRNKVCQQCPACLVCLIWVDFVMDSR